MKPVLFYYVHAHGKGHRATFSILYAELSAFFEVVAVTTNSEITKYIQHHFGAKVVELPKKYPADFTIPEHTFSKPFEVTPYALEPALRAKSLAEALARYQPKAFYCDGSPELAIMVRGMGVPVVLVHLHGNCMSDPTQVFAHQLSDRIIAHFPVGMEQSDYRFGAKTFYSGYISKYAVSHAEHSTLTDNNNVTIVLGYENYDESVLQNITRDKNLTYTIIGDKRAYNLGKNCRLYGQVKDIAGFVHGKIVICAAGQNTIAELLSLGKRLILLPEPRPYDEQAIHAAVLARNNVVLLANEAFSSDQWRNIIERAKTFTPESSNLFNFNAPELIAKKMRKWYA
ncbi:glycosyltransferase [Pedobacter sp. Leaf194]|uniref:glycosyltransferase n=1 Tax=Pedobacter sp. Leaf194 TaxID=1736297 RepID=UPI0007026DA2|nr:glycosyltransferase [Pedobacter sp. Leaf194]KQS36276.1 hypothetical protein ASG14_12695 [Pedobacter sp. Leaf194]